MKIEKNLIQNNMNNALTKTLTAGLMHGLIVQYEGVLNGKELSSYKKDYDERNKHSDLFEMEMYDPPKEVIGIKSAPLKRISQFKKYWLAEAGIHAYKKFYNGKGLKPYLFPMSSLTKEIEFKGERFVPVEKMSEELKLNTIEYCWIAANIHQPAFPMKDLRASVVEWMQKHMFNVEQLTPEEFIEVTEDNNPYK